MVIGVMEGGDGDVGGVMVMGVVMVMWRCDGDVARAMVMERGWW